MIDHEEARKLVIGFINANRRRTEEEADDETVVMDDLTIEKEYGWVFFYNSRRYLETGDMNYALGGNAPIIVEKEDGSLYPTGTAEETEYYIKRYEKQRARQKLWAKFALFKRAKSQ